MGRKHSKVISRDAFTKAFIEAEYVMRKNLAARITEEATGEVNEDFQAGLMRAAEIVFGTLEKAQEEAREDIAEIIVEDKQDDVG